MKRYNECIIETLFAACHVLQYALYYPQGLCINYDTIMYPIIQHITYHVPGLTHSYMDYMNGV